MSLSLRLRRIGAISGLLLSCTIECAAQATDANFTPKLTQYNHRAWRMQDGLFPGSPLSIAQTKDGYIYIGTEAGLLRFDGVHFLPADRSSTYVNVLLAARDGTLWAGTAHGLMRFDGTELQRVPGVDGHINSIAEDIKGTIWVAQSRTSTPLCEVSGTQGHCYGPATEMPCAQGAYVVARPDGSIWLSDGRGVCKLGKNTVRIPLPGSEHPGTSESLAGPVVATEDGMIFGMSRPFKGVLLQQLTAGVWKPLPAAGFDENAGDVQVLSRTKEGSLWVGTSAHGLYRICNGSVDHFGSAEGMSGDYVADFLVDHEGSIWVITTNGVDQFTLPKVLTFTTREGMPGDRAVSLTTSPEGDLWAGFWGAGLVKLHQGKSQLWGSGSGLPGANVSALLMDRRGRLWLGVDRTLQRFEGGQFRAIMNPANAQPGVVVSIVEDIADGIWFETAGGKPNFQLWHVTATDDLQPVLLPSNRSPRAIEPDPHGGVWVISRDRKLLHSDGITFTVVADLPELPSQAEFKAYNGFLLLPTAKGLAQWDGRVWSFLSAANGLPCNWIHSVERTDAGDLWLAMPCANVYVPHDQIQQWQAHPQAHVGITQFRHVDGQQIVATDFAPAIAVTPEGRAWFATDMGLQMIDPAHMQRDLLAPPVHITGVVADNRTLAPANQVRLAPLTRSIQIAYDGLSFVSPENMAFRYRLSGVDRNWQEAGSRREAFYMNLPPGTYTFQVLARNADGVWNTTGDTLSFLLPPTYYQTTWFRILITLFAAFAIIFFFRMRTQRMVALLNARHHERLAERDRIARELHDTLLQGFQMLLFRIHTGVQLIPAEQPARPVLEDALDRAERVLVEGRNSVKNLRREPRESRALAEDLERVIADYRISGGPECTVSIIGTARDLHSEAQEEIRAIGQEALLNALKHACATNICLELRYDKRCFTLICIDDGRGINTDDQERAKVTGHFGLMGMRERAAKIGAQLTVNSAMPRGTTVELRVPASVAYWRAPRFRELFRARSDDADKAPQS